MARILQLTLNGRARTDAVPDNVLLLDYLREQVGLTGTKTGCAALAAVASRFRSSEADLFPQIIQQQNVVGNRVGAGAAVERKLQNARHAVLQWLFLLR